MLGSEQARVALVSADHQAVIGGIVNRNLLEIAFGQRQTLLEEKQQVLKRVAEYTEHTAIVQRLCDHMTQIITLQIQITDQQSQRCLTVLCDHSILAHQWQALI
jgi:hypothetical protein